MNKFGPRSILIILLFTVPLLFIPKINIIGFSQETAGIRIDDIILFLLALLLGFAHFALERSLTKIEKWMAALTTVCFISFFLNRLFVYLGYIPFDAKIFYCVRMFEYFMFFYLGFFLYNYIPARKIVLAFLYVNIVCIFFQKIGLLGEFGPDGYTADATWRPPGICSFPNEMGACLNLIYCYLVFTPKKKRAYFYNTLPLAIRRFCEATGFIWTFLFFAFLIVMTGSRISIAALFFVFLFQLYAEVKKNPRRYIFPIFVITPLIGFIVYESIMNTDSLFRRSAKIFSMENIEKISSVWNYINPHDMKWDELKMSDNIDKSWWVRLHKWTHALKLFVTTPQTWFFGVGPGVTTAGMDGGLLRIFIEQGIVGTYVFWRFFSLIFHKNTALKWMIIVWVINNIFIDIYLAYKPMSLLFLLTGYAYAEQPETAENTIIYQGATENGRVNL